MGSRDLEGSKIIEILVSFFINWWKAPPIEDSYRHKDSQISIIFDLSESRELIFVSANFYLFFFDGIIPYFSLPWYEWFLIFILKILAFAVKMIESVSVSEIFWSKNCRAFAFFVYFSICEFLIVISDVGRRYSVKIYI